MRRVRIAAWAAVAVLVAVLAVANGSGLQRLVSDLSTARKDLVGGPFRLTTHKGTQLSDSDLRGRPFAIFFGFTHCPEVCPTALLELTQTIAALGPDADKMRYLFVSVDPARDTRELLEVYMSNFDSRIVGLTGAQADIDALVKAYRVVVEKVPTSGGYTINHTTLTYLMGRDGKFAGVLGYQETAERRLEKLRRLIRDG
jgi:protein SCO1/2